jgi:DnaJ-class molecular chaperone
MTIAIRKRIRPDAGCMRCGRAYTGPVERTVMCMHPNKTTGLPCGGRITWRANPEDWTECPDCDGTGVRANDACQRCHGDGWLMGSHQPPR